MKPDPHWLLNEILEEAASAAFRSSVLEQTLRRVRRRRIVRQARRGLVALAFLAGLPLVLWKTSLVPDHNTESGLSKITMVSSQPPNVSMILQTKPGDVAIVMSSSGTVVFVETGVAKDLLKEITDDELLVLVAGKPAVLVRQSPHQAELLFVNAEDQNGFRVP